MCANISITTENNFITKRRIPLKDIVVNTRQLKRDILDWKRIYGFVQETKKLETSQKKIQPVNVISIEQLDDGIRKINNYIKENPKKATHATKTRKKLEDLKILVKTAHFKFICDDYEKTYNLPPFEEENYEIVRFKTFSKNKKYDYKIVELVQYLYDRTMIDIKSKKCEK